MSFTVPAMSYVIVTTEVLATSGTASTGTTTPAGSTTTNPGTGANDVVGVAAARCCCSGFRRCHLPEEIS